MLIDVFYRVKQYVIKTIPENIFSKIVGFSKSI